MKDFYDLEREYVHPSKININDRIVVDDELYIVTSISTPLNGKTHYNFGIRFAERPAEPGVGQYSVPREGYVIYRIIK